MILKVCPKCKKEFETKDNDKRRFCSKHCACSRIYIDSKERREHISQAVKNAWKIGKLKPKESKYIKEIRYCEKCGKEFVGDSRNRFCSRFCANSHIQTDKTKLKISKALKGKPISRIARQKYDDKIKENKEKYYLSPNKCKICDDILSYEDRRKKTCKKCRNLAWKGTGGYREGSGRSKFGYYKGIYCGSTYELVYVIYRLDNNLPVKRFEGELTDGKLKYIPDFIEDNTIIEIKGYYQGLVDKKCELAKSKGYNIKVLYKKDLQKEFDWVKKHYQYKNLQELYDNYKPKYKYTCDCCGKEFETDIKRQKNKLKFCSRNCVYHNTHRYKKNAGIV